MAKLTAVRPTAVTRRWRGLAVLGTATAAAVPLVLAAAPVQARTASPAAVQAQAAAPARPQVRVNQVGYGLRSPKVAFAMLAQPVRSVAFTVYGQTAGGREAVVFRGRSSANAGGWN